MIKHVGYMAIRGKNCYQLNIHDLRSPKSRVQVEKQMKQVEERGGLVFETEHVRKDGTLFPVEVSSRVHQD